MMRKLDKRPIHPNLHKCIFKFLPGSELIKNLSVCKEWKGINEQLIEQTQQNIFFMIGDGIRISISRGLTYRSDALFELRKTIPATEITSSFPKKGLVRLFKTEKEALDYSRSLRDCNDFGEYTQPAIFKVQFPHTVKGHCFKHEKLVIKDLISITGEMNREINYFETDVANVIILKGQLKIDAIDNNKFKEYQVVDYKDYAEITQNTSNRCVMM